MRILITGSRDWPDREAVWTVLTRFQKALSGPITVVHGDCPTGADHYAHQWTVMYGVTEERHPADWETHGKAAGPIRNQKMVDLGAAVCLAFPLGASRGTRDCMRRARKARIPVYDLGDGLTASK